MIGRRVAATRKIAMNESPKSRAELAAELEALQARVMGFVQKPYQVNALLSKVRKILDADSRP